VSFIGRPKEIRPAVLHLDYDYIERRTACEKCISKDSDAMRPSSALFARSVWKGTADNMSSSADRLLTIFQQALTLSRTSAQDTMLLSKVTS
jgi:hypothetical protein